MGNTKQHGGRQLPTNQASHAHPLCCFLSPAVTVPPCLLQWSQAVSHWHPFHPMPHREPSELQGMSALEATAWALRVAEYELGIIPVLSAQAIVAGSDPLGLIAYLSHFHSAFKNTPHSSGEWEGRWAGRRVRAGERGQEGRRYHLRTHPRHRAAI